MTSKMSSGCEIGKGIYEVIQVTWNKKIRRSVAIKIIDKMECEVDNNNFSIEILTCL